MVVGLCVSTAGQVFSEKRPAGVATLNVLRNES